MISVAEIHYSVEAEVIIKCPINYSKFPFHTATCKLKVTSVSNRNTTMVFQSDQRPAEKLMNPSVDIYGYYVNTRYLEEKETIALSWDNENEWFSVVGLRINMVSRYWKYLFIYFMPTSMFTMTSWVSHLLPPTSYPARTSLLVTVFLCQVGVFTAAINHTPNSDGGIASPKFIFAKISYHIIGMTALEIWCTSCIIFSFASLLGYVVILCKIMIRCINVVKTQKEEKKEYKAKTFKDEIVIFIINSCCFIIFNICFWFMYV